MAAFAMSILSLEMRNLFRKHGTLTHIMELTLVVLQLCLFWSQIML